MATAELTRETQGRQARPVAPTRAVTIAAGVCVAAGVLWRLVRYLLQFPIWGDEGFVLINVLDCDYAGLTGTLKYNQVAPLLFLWGEKLSLDLLGGGEWAVRLLPFLAGTAGLAVFAWACRRGLEPLPAALAVSILAASYFPVRHACEVKPYAPDLLMSAGFLLGAVGWLRDRSRPGWLVFLVAWTPLALTSSYPAVFVAGAVAIVLLPHMRSANWAARGLYALFGLLTAGTFVGHYLLVGGRQVNTEEARAIHDFMQNYWQDGFPPDDLVRLPLWLVKAHTGFLFAYPVGGRNGVSAVSTLLAIAGAVHLWRRGQRSLVALCVLPFVLSLAAAFLHKYPYGASTRLAQHLAPMICLLMGVGLASLLARLSEPVRHRWAVVICLTLAAYALVGVARDGQRPYKTEFDHEVRQFVRAFWAEARPDDAVLACNDRDGVTVAMSWYLRRDGHPVHYLDTPRRDFDRPRLWLFQFHPNAATAEQLMAHLGDAARDWAPVKLEQKLMPPEFVHERPYYATRLLLVRGTPSVE